MFLQLIFWLSIIMIIQVRKEFKNTIVCNAT